MKPKWTIVLTLATAGSIWGIKIYYDEQAYNKQMRIARNAVAGHEWEIARTAYQKSRKIHVSVENRTASQQLNYLENADNEIKQHNWESAVNMYNQALTVDGGVELLNKAATTGKTCVDALRNSGEAQQKVQQLTDQVIQQSSEIVALQSSASDALKADSANNVLSSAKKAQSKQNKSDDRQKQKSDTNSSRVEESKK
ncbi:hypothetical protein HAU47_08495 [Weissella confusa]|uniref:hypothetical protein n=1 Tax=Weissella confusa TaxID=1583 RepID=UPI0018F1E7A1|nr:hypothetical protein [Weissella confusa]MBJ7620502.1 hypothetical protein [Weissella confusa]MBJ7667948.1 hypothetical protein [Weissella confusa]